MNGITEFLRKLTTAYTMYFNKKYDRVGPLFQGTFKAQHVDQDEYLKYLFAYIHLNPVKTVDGGWGEKHITDHSKAKSFLGSYAYSSYLDLSGTKRPEVAVLSSNEFPEYFGKTELVDLLDEWMNFDDGSPKEKDEKSRDAILDDAKEGEDLMAQFLAE